MAIPGAVSALQAALAAEDAAVYGYGVAGAHLAGSRQDAAEQDWTGHSQARDNLAVMISRLGAVPVAAQAFYKLPFSVHDTASAMALAAYLEDGVTRAYLGIVAVSDQRLRDFGALAMQGPAARAAYWRGRTQAFPGLALPLVQGHDRGGDLEQPQVGAVAADQLEADGQARPRQAGRDRDGCRDLMSLASSVAGVAHRSNNGPQSLRSSEASTRTIVVAARSTSSATAIRSAHDHQNHHMPSLPQPT